MLNVLFFLGPPQPVASGGPHEFLRMLLLNKA